MQILKCCRIEWLVKINNYRNKFQINLIFAQPKRRMEAIPAMVMNFIWNIFVSCYNYMHLNFGYSVRLLHENESRIKTQRPCSVASWTSHNARQRQHFFTQIANSQCCLVCVCLFVMLLLLLLLLSSWLCRNRSYFCCCSYLSAFLCSRNDCAWVYWWHGIGSFSLKFQLWLPFSFGQFKYMYTRHAPSHSLPPLHRRLSASVALWVRIFIFVAVVVDLKIFVAYYLRFRLNIKNGLSRDPNGFNSAKISHHMDVAQCQLT